MSCGNIAGYLYQRPKIRERIQIHDNPYYGVAQVTVEFDGFTKQYYPGDHGRRVGIIIRNDNKILLVRQYRLIIDDLSWEIPGGGIDKSESPEQAAVRECLEETNIQVRRVMPLLKYHQGLDLVICPTYLFHTNDYIEGEPPESNPREVVSQSWVTLTECQEMISQGQIVDGFSIVAIMAYLRFIESGWSQAVAGDF